MTSGSPHRFTTWMHHHLVPSRGCLFLSIGAVAVWMTAGALAQTSPSALMERGKQFGAALESRDAARVASFYTDDATVVGADGQVAKGRDAIKASFVEFFKDPDASLAGSPVRHEVSGDLAYVFGDFSASAKGARVQGHYVEVWKRVGGEWKIAYDLVTAVPPPK